MFLLGIDAGSLSLTAAVVVGTTKSRSSYDNVSHRENTYTCVTNVFTVTNQDTSLLDQGKITEPPTLRGYLSKYTNVARGYNTRWFVLKNGTLSCELIHTYRTCL